MFTRKHYEKVAEALNWVKPINDYYLDNLGNAQPMLSSKRYQQWEATVKELCSMFSKDNGNFDRDRFTRACNSQ